MENIQSYLCAKNDLSKSKIGTTKNLIMPKSQINTGKHCILELYNCNKIKLNDESFISTTMALSAKLAGATLVNLITHRFAPQGVTALALLAESHMSIHTWPEIGYGAVDVFTCGDQAMPERACDVLIREFNAGHSSLKTLERSIPRKTSI